MRQLALQIRSAAPPSLDNFLIGRNQELMAALRAAGSQRETLIYFWGPSGSGKTHLLRGLRAVLQADGRPCRLLSGHAGGSMPDGDDDGLLIDDIDALPPAAAEAVFHAWNRIREQGGLLVCTGRQAPAALPLAPELSSRLAWGEVHRLHCPDETQIRALLRRRASEQGLPIAEDTLDYLLSRAPRDLPSLLRLVDALDDLSLATHRAVTIPLVRELLNDALPLQPGALT